MTKSIRAAGLFMLLATPALTSLQGCTDLTETPVSAITPENFYRNEGEVLSGVVSVYAEMRNTLNAYYNVTQVSSDENIIPTRGTDWYDNGKWLELHRQTWEANSSSGLDEINGAWNNLFTGIARANVVLNALETVNVANEAVMEAELKVLRAFFYYLLMDMFGGVPIVTTTEVVARPRNTRAEVFAFVESELLEAREVLPDEWPANMNGRITKGGADAILASIYVNAQVFTGTVTTAGLQPGAAKWQEAVTVSDRILNSGTYSLATNFRSNFTADNHLSPELILVVKHLNADGLGLTFLQRALHYTQLTSSPWNGFATIAETYNAFDNADQRKQIFLAGRQFSLEDSTPVNDRTGAPLFFNPDIGDITQATEGAGVRIAKWPNDPDHVAQNQGNDFAYFRLGEIILIKAEALNELGQTAAAVALVNQLRARAFSPAKPLSAGSFTQASFRDEILRERLFELTSEGKRRQDLVRHGKFLLPWSFKPSKAAEGYRILMPIPQSQLATNPLLTQNPGY
ncbi:MAG: RagB/SusD family nutrient uptake outer membrane protein [Gemmatimonadaceae bacterium]|nr:RagB/SusD family nutrient uptake outer membrane protein [Gemmatimonadaceae bacterium]